MTFSPVDGLRVNATPVPERSPLLPKTIWTTLTAVPSVVRDLVRAAVHLRARRVPRLEDGADRADELVARVRRELARLRVAVDALEGLDELLQVVGRQVGVRGDAAVPLEVGERGLEQLPVDPVDDLAEHLDQAPVRVVGEARVAGPRREALGGVVVQAEVEDRVHHPGHRDRGARTHRHEERVVVRAERPPGALLEAADVLGDLLLEALGQLVRLQERAARVGRDVNPPGTGTPICVISARPVPLPPSSSRPPSDGSSKSYTYLAAAIGPESSHGGLSGVAVSVTTGPPRASRCVRAKARSGSTRPHRCRTGGRCGKLRPRPPARAELREPGERAEREPERREEPVEEDERRAERGVPRGPPPRRDRRLRLHADAARASAVRPSTSRMIRRAISSIDSSETSSTGQPSRRWTCEA